MTRAVILSLIMVWALAGPGAAPARADANSDADQLVIEAIIWLEKARAEPDLGLRVRFMTLAEENLLQVIESYPSSDAAVKLAAGQGIGTLPLERLAAEKMKYRVLAISARAAAQVAARAEIEAEACFAAPSRECLWEQVLAVASDAKYDWGRGRILAHLVAAQIDAGYLGEALFTANEIVDAKNQIKAYGDLAAAETEAGNELGAISVAKKIREEHGRAQVFLRLAVGRVNAESFIRAQTYISMALALAEEPTKFAERAELYSGIANIQAMVGEQEQARNTFGYALALAKRIREDKDRVAVLAKIATFQAEAGFKKEAERTIAKAMVSAKKTTSSYDHSSLLVKIAVAHAKVVDLEVALASVREIGVSEYLNDALADISFAEARAGHVKKALRIVKGIGDTKRRGRALMNIAISQARAGDVKGGVVTANEIGSTWFRRWALVWVAEIQSEAGKPNQALRTIAEALPVAGETLDAVDRGRILAVKAKIQNKVGDIKGAQQYVSEALAAAIEVESDYFRVWIFLRIASMMPD